jgi:nicotinamide phosphoribosyltransferase
VNNILRTDSYKLTHWKQYPPDTEIVHSYLESRGGFFDQTLFAGAQYYTKLLEGSVFNMADVENAREISALHLGSDAYFNLEGWTNLYRKHRGRLPLKIRALPEGIVVPCHTPLVTVENTDPEFPWLTNWAETLLLKIWYPITVATLAREIRQVIGEALVRTGDPSLIDFKLHDFGYRGVSSEESAGIGSFAHLISFKGTDTLAGIDLCRRIYHCQMAGFSIPATEHSTITSWGEEHEADAYRNVLESYPDGLVACVSDSYDIHKAVKNIWGGELRDGVMRRNGCLVIRPDSGEPVQIMEDIFNILWERFGGEVNSKGWKVLAPCVRVIQGDGVNYHTIQNMISQLTRKGWSMDNFAFGMGGALLQQLNRDTLRFAFKCSAIRRAGVWHDVYKKPKTDMSKASKGGRFTVVKNGNDYRTGHYSDETVITDDLLQPIFLDGQSLSWHTMGTIRDRAMKFDRF